MSNLIHELKYFLNQEVPVDIPLATFILYGVSYTAFAVVSLILLIKTLRSKI